MTWFNPDGLLVKFGQEKVVPNTGGELKTYDTVRFIEQRVDLSTLGTSAAILNDTIFYPKAMTLEDVQLETLTAITGGITSLSFGLVQSDRATNISDTAFISAQTVAGMSGTPGFRTTYTGGTAQGGSIGSVIIGSSASFTGLLTGKLAGNSGTGSVLLRLHLRMDPTVQGDV